MAKPKIPKATFNLSGDIGSGRTDAHTSDAHTYLSHPGLGAYPDLDEQRRLRRLRAQAERRRLELRRVRGEAEKESRQNHQSPIHAPVPGHTIALRSFYYGLAIGLTLGAARLVFGLPPAPLGDALLAILLAFVAGLNLALASKRS